MAFSFFKIQEKDLTEQKRYAEPFHVKYHPKKLKDVIGQEHVIHALQKSLCSPDMPHLLFYGPSGSGKSSTIKALCHELYGSRLKDYVLQLNASDERGIGIVRDKIKNFAQYGSTTRKNGARFKIIILDEADNITDDAQTALRRTMETYSRSTRFCIICNHISNINHPLRSRCAVYRFKPLLGVQVIDHVKKIVDQEKLSFDNDKLVEYIVHLNNGDFRKILTQLEVLKTYYGNRADTNSDGKKNGVIAHGSLGAITKGEIEDAARVIPAYIICDLMNSQSIDMIVSKLNNVFKKGYNGSRLLFQIFEFVINSYDFTETTKKSVIKHIALCEYRLSHGSDELIQLTDLLSFLV